MIEEFLHIFKKIFMSQTNGKLKSEFFHIISFFSSLKKKKRKKKEIQERKKSLLFKVLFAHWFRWPTTSANSRTKDRKRKGKTLSSVQPEETEENGTNEGNRRKWTVLCPLQGIARWKSNNNIFNSTNEFCFSYLFRIPRRLKCSLGYLLHYLLFHPCYFFFSIHLFGHQRVGEGETEETMQFHLWDSGAQSGNQNEREKVSRSGKKLISPPLMQFISFVRGSMGGGGAQ